ncbi:uncharacterized protein LOC110708318 [Chenopodium quinoa]|uniref:uncharacterized protein LOC110708318 n=1 Tax=Chenopodium quinoa TaxID=63459 RepID=UPI000B76E7F5|nr:uncharacterized protein LOC110708318 [Chenopodium quinoa]
MRLGIQQNDIDSSTGQSLSGSFRKSTSVFGENDSSPGHDVDGSFRKSNTGFHHNDLDLYSAQTFDESFRKPKTGVCKGSSGLSSLNKLAPISKRAYKSLKDCARNLVDSELFIQSLEDWILENSLTDSNHEYSFDSPFQIDELRQLDYALEGTFFQQLFRMPTSLYCSSDLKEEEYFALEDFLHTMADGLWRTFWHKSSPSPFVVSCARHPRSRFYSLDKAISRGKVAELCGAALIARDGNDVNIHWDQVVQLSLFKPDIMLGNKLGISLNALSEALFYGFHILISRRLSKRCEFNDNSVYIMVMDSKFGAVVKLTGDVCHLELNVDNPYQAVAEWMKTYSEVSVSTVDRIWNKLGNANWGDLGTLQLLLATFYSIVQFGGSPRKSIASLASDHSLRLQKRRIECHLLETETGKHPSHDYAQGEREIVELEHEVNPAIMHQASHLMLQEGDIIHVEDQQQGEKSFQIHEPLFDEKSFCYSALSLENPTQLLTLYVGAHPSRLEPSWEDMSLWYQVQRQTKVLNVLRQAGISSKYLPEIVASGKMLHPGSCKKKNPNEKCDHPLCGTPVLVIFPIGEPVSSIVSQDGPFSCEEVIRCCRDCLAALRSAKIANVQHGDICPENVVRVSDAQGSSSSFFYVPVSWGRAVLEERDGPAMNLFFSSSHTLQHGKLCPSSDVESLVYLLYFLCGGNMQQQDSIESALQWRQRSWAKRHIQRHLGEVSAILKAFADYVDTLCGTPYPVDYDGWLKRLDKTVNESADQGKLVEEMALNMRIEDIAGSSGISEGGS